MDKTQTLQMPNKAQSTVHKEPKEFVFLTRVKIVFCLDVWSVCALKGFTNYQLPFTNY